MHSFSDCNFHPCKSLFLSASFFQARVLLAETALSLHLRCHHSFSEQYHLYLQTIRNGMVYKSTSGTFAISYCDFIMPVAPRSVSVVISPFNGSNSLILLICCWFCISDTVANIMLVEFFNPLYDCSNCLNLPISSTSVVRISFICID